MSAQKRKKQQEMLVFFLFVFYLVKKIRNNAQLSTDTTKLDRKDENKTCGRNIFRAIWLAFESKHGEEKPLQCLACK